jgi:flagellar motility protein MotE (MotC chaperone)
MENALLGDSMIEKLRAEGTESAKEREDVMTKLQDQAMALSKEREEKLKVLADQDSILAKATVLEKEAEERILAREQAMEAALAEVSTHCTCHA